jgi:tRNA dimethylallyltransferase
MELARAIRSEGRDAEVLSVDSMQVYRHMNVGTAKPTDAERAEVRHHLLDIVNPSETFAVAQFVELAKTVIGDVQSRGAALIATGGTPLYFKALFEGLFEGPGADETIRARLSNESTGDLRARLETIDPAAAQRIQTNDRRRMIRAIEVFELTGQAISSLQTHWESKQSKYDARWFGLTWEREALNRRINARVKQMIEHGWLEETRELIAKYGPLSKTASEATGYAELLDHLAGKVSLDDAIETIKIATRQLARRQMKWFRRFPNVTWLDGQLDLNQLVERVRT